MNYKKGDLIYFDMPEYVDVLVNGIYTYKAKFGEFNGKYGLKIKD
jgi:flagellar motor switch protein FliM